MNLVYLTSKTYPASTADHFYILELAREFSRLLQKNFLLVVVRDISGDLKNVPHLATNYRWRLRTIFYFFWIPYFVLSSRRHTKDTVFFLNDPNLLVLLIFWRKVFFFHYRICSDWHMLFGDWRDRFIVQGSDRMITTSRKLKNGLIKIVPARGDAILAAYGGVHLDYYSPDCHTDAARQNLRCALNLPVDKHIIAYAGFFKTMGMEKGIALMIRALPLLARDTIMLFIGGTDPEIAEYKQFAETLGVLPRCLFFGRTKTRELARYEQAADALAIPYPDQPHFRNYGFPMKVYEYMASGTPIIYSRLELAEEVLGDYAFSFAPDNVADFARAVKEVLGDIDTAGHCARMARAKAEEYTWDKKAERIIQFLGYS